MKTLLFLLAISSMRSAYGQENPEQTLMGLESRRLEAIVKKDTSAIQKIYDDHYMGVLASGQSVDKTKQIEFHLSASPHIALSIEDVKATVHGTIGITTGKQLNKAKSGHIIGQTKFIHVYQKHGDKWTIIRSQGTIVVQE